MHLKITVALLLVATLCSCQFINAIRNRQDYDSDYEENMGYRIIKVDIYKDTPAWDLAMAVNSQNDDKIKKLAKTNPELLNYKDPEFGTTLLVWAVGTERYKSTEALLAAGADTEIVSTYVGGTALYLAAGFSWVDNFAKQDAKYVELLLKYGSDPNTIYIGSERDSIAEIGDSALMASIGCGIDKTKALVEGGADINQRTKSGGTATIAALNEGINATLEGMGYAHYLISEKKADVTEPYYIDDPDIKFYPVSILREWISVDSDEHKLKMDIVNEFVRQGVDYWDTEIPERTLKQIQKIYPDTWQEYIKQY